MTEHNLFNQPPMAVAVKKRDIGMLKVAVNAGEEFGRKARAFVIEFLRKNGSATGEDITDAGKAAGIIPHNDKAWGPVYMALSRSKTIAKDLSAPPSPRRKGHSSGIAWRWKLVNDPLHDALRTGAIGINP